MAEEMGVEAVEAAAEASPQWLKDYQAPDGIDLSPIHSLDGSSSPEREDVAVRSKRRRIELSDSEEEDQAKQEIRENAAVEEKEHEEQRQEIEEHEEEAIPEDPKPETKKIKTKMASSLPLMFPDKISRSKILLECEDEALDMSGDVGAVGRVSVCESDSSKLFLDLKGTVYGTNIVASNSFFLVNIGPTEAKVEALMNDFVQLVPDAGSKNIETMIEGTLDGITFDSDNEGAAASTAAPTKEDGKTEKTEKANNGVKKTRKPKDKPKAAASKRSASTRTAASSSSKRAIKKPK